MIVILALFNPALIILSSVAGAALIVQVFQLSPLVTGFVFLALLIVGIAIQARMLPAKT